MELDDSKIIDLFYARSEQAIVELSTKYGAVCSRVARNILNNPHDAEECVNDAYLGAWNTIPPQNPNPLIDWVPNATIRALTDNANSTIATLPQELREDVIVMEIAFENGTTRTKAITVSLLEDGSFFAQFGDYEITAEDSFIDRPDSESIPRNILDSQDDCSAWDDKLKIAEKAARAYYENTVFEVVSLKLKSQTENEISFSVCVSKGGIVQEPDRTIFLEFVDGHWEVVQEGY